MEFGLKGTSRLCRGRHREVGIVEFGRKQAERKPVKRRVRLLVCAVGLRYAQLSRRGSVEPAASQYSVRSLSAPVHSLRLGDTRVVNLLTPLCGNVVGRVCCMVS